MQMLTSMEYQMHVTFVQEAMIMQMLTAMEYQMRVMMIGYLMKTQHFLIIMPFNPVNPQQLIQELI